MAFLGRARKPDLVELAGELGLGVTKEMTVIDLKNLISKSESFDEEFVKAQLEVICEDRKNKEERECEERRLKEEREREERRLKEERELKMEDLRIKEKCEMEALKLKEKEYEIEKLRIEAEQSKLTNLKVEDSKGFNCKLTKVVPKFDPQAGDIVLFLTLFERQSKRFGIEKEHWVSALLALLPNDITQLIARESEENFDDYEYIKGVLLRRFKLSPETFRQKFVKHQRNPNNSWRDFIFEITRYFEEWIEGMDIKDFNELKNLIITDQVKKRVPVEVREHFVDEWSKFAIPSDLADKLDEYESIRSSSKKFNKSERFEKVPVPAYSKYREEGTKNKYMNQYKKFSASNVEKNEKIKSSFIPTCFTCGKEGHLRKFCPRYNQVSGKTSKNDLEKKGLNKVGVNLSNTSFEGKFPISDTDGELPKVSLGLGSSKFQGIIDSGAEITVLRKSVVPEEYLEAGGKILLRPAIGNPVEAQLVSVPLSLWTEEDIIPYVRVHVAVVEGLHEEALVTPKVYGWLKEQENAYLGKEIETIPVEIANKESLLGANEEDLKNDSSGDEVNITPVEEGGEQSLFNERGSNLKNETNNSQTTEDIGKLMFCVKERNPKKKIKIRLKSNDSESEELEVYTTPVETTVLPENDDKAEEKTFFVSQAQLFKKEQLSCSTLEKCFQEAREQKNNYWIEADLLYHMGKVGGQKYVQLVVPACRRKEILKLAHEAPVGGHLAAKKTRDRIAMSFWWEGMPKEVKELCASCHDCQMRRKVRVNDRAPIEAVGRPELPFQVVNADILGPIEPKSSRGHQYVLCVMDQHSRWPEAIPIKSLTAKAACDAFIEIFVRTGIPRVIAMDNGTNFASKLTEEFLKRLGCVPKFSTPGYPQSNGLVERWIGTIKSMLHHAINSHGRGWDKQLPFLLWAYREVPNATTGVAPFLLVHGRPPVGPLAILKSSWEDDVILPQGVGESISEYMQKLRKRLEDAAQYADNVAKDQQQRYQHHHNLRSKDTEFLVGDEVVVLIPDSTNKLCSKWKGPGEIVKKKSSHSFLVKLPDGSVRHLHQNKLRKYIQPIRAVGVIYETDEEFGEIQHAPVESRQVTDNELKLNVEPNAITSKQYKELLKLIKEYKTVFDGELKKAKVGSHVIQLKPGVERKQPHIYKVPETLRSNVEKQITELLRKDLIEPSSAEIAYPLVCVAKKDGTIRLCVDYRELNSASKISPFPMQNSSNLRFKAGNAKYLTTLDILKGYWEIPLEKNSRELTSFVSPKGQYQWKVMPFGLSGAPATFQRTMNQALRPHSDYAESFLDDIIVFSSTWDEHIRHLEAVLQTLKTLNFSANLKKCSFAMAKVKYLGHIVGSGEHGPDPGKIASIKNLKAPTTKKALRSILGLFNYYREYIPHYANIAKPLTDLTRKAIPNNIPWSDEAETAFNLLKTKLCSITSLSTPDMCKPFEMHTDASMTGIGACLMQRNQENQLTPITFASQKLTPTQSKWSTIEREAYAVIWALGKFEEWTYGTVITLHTDHNPLKYLTEGVPKNARLQRWALALSRYQVSIKHKAGSANTVADALSRIYE